MGFGALSRLAAALIALLHLPIPPVEGVLARFWLLGEDATQYSCLPQAYFEKRPAALEDPLEVKVVGSSNECMTAANLEVLDVDDVNEVSGKVAVFGLCSDAASDVEYYQDYFFKTQRLEQEGAVMVIPVEAWFAKLPGHMDQGGLTRILGVPICIMEKRHLRGLELELGKEQGRRGNFSSLIFYNSADEPEFDTPITTISVTGGDHTFTIPATTSTFNNDTTLAVTGKLLPLELRPECYHRQSDNWEKCVECWSSDRIGNVLGPVLNNDEIISASSSDDQYVLFVGLESHGSLKAHLTTCFGFYYHWSVFGALLLTDAVMIGGLSDTRLAIPGPYLVGSPTVPTFSIINMHSNTFSNLLTEQQELGDVVVKLPALNRKQGPPFYAPVEAELGITRIDFWQDSLDRHFDCFAGQAVYNPERHNGSSAPWVTNDTYRILYVRPSADCANETTCGRCLSKPTGKLDLNPDLSYSSIVMLLDEGDFPCFLRHSEFSKAAVEANPYALIVAQRADASHTVTDTELARLAFPTFMVDKECGKLLISTCDHEEGPCNETLIAQLPKLENGAAVEHEMTYVEDEEEKEPAFVKITSPDADLDIGQQALGTVNFNPRNYPSVNAEVVLAHTKDVCNSEETCLECDRSDWRWKEDREVFSGHIVLFFLVSVDETQMKDEDEDFIVHVDDLTGQGTCLLPRSNIVKDMQTAGAEGVIFVDFDSKILTYVQKGVPPGEVTIPSFNAPLSLGLKLLRHIDKGLMASFPRIVNGAPVSGVPDPGSQPDDNGRDDITANDLTSSGLLLPVWAIGLSTVGGALFLLGCSGVIYFVRRKRRMFAYNQMDIAVQADILVDVMALRGDESFGDGGFKNEPLDSDGSGSDDEGGRYVGGGGRMQVVELTSRK